MTCSDPHAHDRSAAGNSTKLHIVTAQPWPDIADEHRWTIELMEKQLRRTTRTPEELRARAGQLRVQAAETELAGVRDATLALAERYDEAAVARLVSQ